MKKITLLLFLTISSFVHAQWSTLIADGTFDQSLSDGCSYPLTFDYWGRCAPNRISIVDGECQFESGYAPTLSQRFLVPSNTMYKIQFQCFVKTSTQMDKDVQIKIKPGIGGNNLSGLSKINDGRITTGNVFLLDNLEVNEDNPGNNYTYEFLFSTGTNTDVMIEVFIANPSQHVYFDNFAMVEDTSLSLKKESSTAFSYSPNPARTHINLSAKTVIKSAELLNSIGKKIMSKDIQSNNGVLNIAHLQSGVYILKVFLEDTIVSRKILIE